MIGQVHAHPEWKLIVERLSVADYNTLVAHSEIAEWTGLAYATARYFGQVRRAATMLRREHDRVLVSDTGVGYRIIKADECETESRRQAKIANRRMRRARETSAAAPDRLLTEEQRQRKTNTLSKLGVLEAMMRKTLREIRPAAIAPRPDTPKMLT